jgi:hypothetical protein
MLSGLKKNIALDQKLHISSKVINSHQAMYPTGGQHFCLVFEYK